MAKSGSTPSPAPRPFVSSRGFSRGNGSPAPETDADRLAHNEEVLTRIQATLDTQFQRISDTQVLIDRLTAGTKPLTVMNPKSDVIQPPPARCPYCVESDVDEQLPFEGAVFGWFHCHRCGLVWHEHLPRP